MCNKENFEFYTDEQVNTLQTYIEEHYTLDGTSKHLIRNILEYVAAQGDDEENIVYMLTNLLDGIGITEDEIVNAVVSELDYATKQAMEEAENLVSKLFNNLESTINATIAGCEVEKVSIDDVKDMLKEEPNSPEKSI